MVSVDTIVKHGSSLKELELELHETELHISGPRRGLLSKEDVRRKCEECPRRKDLSLDMDREDSPKRGSDHRLFEEIYPSCGPIQF